MQQLERHLRSQRDESWDEGWDEGWEKDWEKDWEAAGEGEGESIGEPGDMRGVPGTAAAVLAVGDEGAPPSP